VRRASAFAVALAAALVLVLPLRVLAAVEVREAGSLPWWCASVVRVAGEEGSVNLEEVWAECTWLERQFPGLNARVLAFPRPVVASGSWWAEAGYRTPDGEPVEGNRVSGIASPSALEACVFDCLGCEAFVVAHELGHLAWFQLLSPGQRAEYAALRGLQGKPEWYVWECFAEDFRLAFGCRRACCPEHSLLACGPPAEFAGLFAGVRDPAGRLRWAASGGRVDVFVEERRGAFPDVQPWVDGEGRAWAPLRPVAEALGRVVRYDPWTERAFVGDLEFDLRGGSGPGGLELVLRDGRACCPLEGPARFLGSR